MGLVTIEGSLMPSVYLARGERRTVEATDDIRNLVKIGAAIVVSGRLYGPNTALPVLDEQVWSPGDSPILPPLPDSAYPPDAEPLDPLPESETAGPPTVELPADGSPPPKNAKREVWAAFLGSKGVAFPDGDEAAGEEWAGRDDLIIIWQQASGGS